MSLRSNRSGAVAEGSSHGIRCQAAQAHVAVSEAGHEVDVLRRHLRVPAADHRTHRGGVERLDRQFRDAPEVRAWRTTDRDQLHAAVRAPYRIPQWLDPLRLHFIRDHGQPHVRRLRGGVDQIGQPDVVRLANVDDRGAPRRAATQLQCESGLADTRLTPNMQVADAVFVALCVEVELGEHIGHRGRDPRRFLIRNPMYLAPRPVVERLQPRGSPGPARRYGGMLIAPFGEPLATVDLDVPARYSGTVGGDPQPVQAPPHAGLAGFRAAGHYDESAARLQRAPRHRLRHLAGQLGGLHGAAGLELPAGIRAAKPRIVVSGPGRPAVAAIVGCAGFRVDDGIRATAAVGLRAQQGAQQRMQLGIVQRGDTDRRYLQRVAEDPRSVHGASIV